MCFFFCSLACLLRSPRGAVPADTAVLPPPMCSRVLPQPDSRFHGVGPFLPPFPPPVFALHFLSSFWVPLRVIKAMISVGTSPGKIQQVEDRRGSNAPNSLVVAFGARFGRCPAPAGWCHLLCCCVFACVFFLGSFLCWVRGR